MFPEAAKLKDILLKGSYISEADSKAAEEAEQHGGSYVDYLIKNELLSYNVLGQAIAEAYHMPFVDLGAHPPTKEMTQYIPEPVARKQRLVFVKGKDTGIGVATDQPGSVDMNQIKALFPGKKVHVAYALPMHIDTSLQLYEQPLETRFSQIMSAGERVAPEMVNEIIKDAANYRASDIHFEPQATEVIVRFRIDGSLREAGKIPREQYENILNRIKVESGMRIDEHLAAQDGAMQRHGSGYTTDLRVSLVPTVNGEKVVMRVLGSYVQSFSLDDLGMGPEQRQHIEAEAKKPFGMILTVGPTGSGKTTTLYALLKMLNQPNVNITTIEDPVEYRMPGINQIQVRQQTNMTFAQGLRSIVRQDPDIVLVGEIRDQETAEIGVNAALTGHLLLSTFHANDAATAIPRLFDMGIEPFLLSSTLQVVIAQRLARKLCSHCRYSVQLATVLDQLGPTAQGLGNYFRGVSTVYAGKGCNICNGTGYVGRVALFECIYITPEMQELMLDNPSTQQIWALARKQGTVSMFEDGVAKVKQGITSVSEVLRVVAPPKGSAK